ncbi:hypothetical protein V5T82_08565 [Magnetovibrio sp. PR-2]|uniref:hypothetical protein n=1 Tax=Magnetovibrio sp. PR-2 TaxID=3120356 RepID=UPI002FCE0838
MSSPVTEHVAVVESDQFKASNTRRLYDYIVEKRGERVRPSLSDIDLMDLYKIAPSICIRDVVDDGKDLKCRYWGGDFEFVYKVNCSGKRVTETYGQQGAQNTLALHHRALEADKPLRLVGNLGYADKDIDHVMFEGIMVCLDGKDFAKQHVLAVGQFDYDLDDEDRDLIYVQCGKRF